MGDGEGATTFSAPHIQRSKALRCGIVAALACLLLYQMASSTETTVVKVYMALVAALAAVMAVAAVRALRSGFVLDDEGVTVRGSFSTRRWRWDEIASAEVQDRSHTQRALAGFNTGRGRPDTRVVVLPFLRLTSGKTALLYSARVTLAEPDSSNWVDEAVREINRRVEQRRAQGDPAATPQ